MSKLEFVQYICSQLDGAGNVTYRKMFGEYALYLDGKIFALICDNMLFVKITEAGAKVMPNLEKVPPYDGAKPYFLVEDTDDRDALREFICATCDELPEPKPKKPRKKKKSSDES